ncbi:zinc metalloprotease HtpX [Rarobacter faecitabidus]|uniref:Protease HtpX homolog n=1 Tax=Rarobacter faecitabidus TaxID=13243 RepID=A0A542ZTT0_RARFA|nr:zinc metalloprotease HtpX [Rarobacter faecitabidus]TQL63762.1 heat shock protein [Rarobacter faecitabidus]
MGISRGHHNGLKTALLFGGMWAVLLGIWALVGNGSSSLLILFCGVGLVSTALGYWNSASIAIRSMQAYPVTEQDQPAMYRIVRELSATANQPMPKLYVSPTAAPNAFATGRNPQNAAVCCTEGILQLLDERELRGVLGHELMHVYNRDILTASVASGIAGVISTVAQFLLFFGGGRDRNSANPLVAILIALLAPLASAIIQMSISRTREYDADEDGAALTGDPLALASALQKLESGTRRAPLPDTPKLENVSHLMIANPFGGTVRSLLATHPPMDKRIERLRRMAGGPVTYY